ncbi:RluA family pseudouridine synthase [Thalassolituus sp.]|jgi:tRNA pseudouridine32 synthase/23S rRNA pseudouridine746 synthase|uniref:RluA family pseudouridine synthase n=1 Tax=Thalassolituus sp. TaxID=2030822 RepID=UPI002A7EA761|nr:RluA family pseudouridine synthase [Thalassolituus sp.]|tara:strand:- start:187 stop:804 length:618 start_codon:yes stop_codon:yes gene_type:complete
MTQMNLLHIDDDIIIINKQSGLLSVPGRYIKDSAVSRLAERYGDIFVIHRLDQDTSGILVFARNKAALTGVQQQFEKQTTRKVYEAVVLGRVKGNMGCINMPIIVDWPNRPLQMISHSDGRYALTRWNKMAEEDGNTRIELHPKTGRSHQLRLHMQQIGHPIVGDTLYAGAGAELEPRLKLHARELDFRHPVSGELFEIVCQPDF